MSFAIKKTLLAGTAFVAASSFVIQARAADGHTTSGTETISTSYTGGNGTNGGANTAGTAGDDGVQITTGTATTTNVSPAIQHGGNGGTSGSTSAADTDGIMGGMGGNGYNMQADGTAATAGNHVTLTINGGSAIGGNGNMGGDAGAGTAFGGMGGTGGAGVNVDSNFAVVTNAGTLTGGGGGNSGATNNTTADYNHSYGTNGGTGGNGIHVLADNVIITNTGIISGGGGGIGGSALNQGLDGLEGSGVLITGANAVLTNGSAGHINSDTGSSVEIQNDMTRLTNNGTITAVDGNGILVGSGTLDLLTNNATISSTGGGAGINNTGVITSLVNNSLITTENGNAILSAGTIGTITNTNHSITATGAGNAIRSGGVDLIGLINNNNGTLSALNGSGILRDGGEGAITLITNNGGTISTTTGTSIFNDGTIGTFNNTRGLITTQSGAAIDNDGSEGNFGTIETLTNDNGQIVATAGGDALYNAGVITTLTNNRGIITTDTGTAINNNDGAEGGIGHIVTLNNERGIISATAAGGTAINNTDFSTIDTLDNNSGSITANGSESTAVRNLGAIGTLTNNGGTITADDDAISNSGSLGAFNNTNGRITANTGDGITSSGAIGTFNNTNGVIRSASGSAVELNASITSGVLDNTGGLLSAGSSDNSTLYIGTDVGEFTVRGGTIVNTDSAENDGRAVRIDNAQSNIISFLGTTIISDGQVAGSGGGNAFRISGGGTNIGIQLDPDTVVRGNIVDTDDDNLYLGTAARIKGNVTLGDGDDALIIYGGALNGTVNLGGGDNTLAVVGTDFTTQGAITTSGNTDLFADQQGTFNVVNTIQAGGGDINVLNGSTLNVQAPTLTATGTLTNNAVLRIGADSQVNAGALNTASTGTFTFDARGVDNQLETGLLHLTGAANFANKTFEANYLRGALVIPTRSLIVTGTGTASIAGATVTDNSFLYDFGLEAGTVATSDANDIYLTLVRATTLADASTSSNNEKAATVLLNDFGTSNDPRINQIQGNLGEASNKKQFNDIVESTQPTTDNGSPMAAANFTGQVFDVADSQLAMVNTGDPTGVAAGDMAKGLHPWAQAFGQHADQDDRSGVDGYRANTVGGAFGVDTRNLNEDTVVGMSLAYGYTHVNSENANSTDTNVNTYQATLYGNHAFGDTDYFVAGMGAVGYDRNHETRHDVGGIDDLDASAGYDSWQGAGRVEGGRNFRMAGPLTGLTLTPILTADYIHYSAESYDEKGAGGANLQVGHQNEDMLQFGIGGRAQYLIKADNGLSFKPDVHASYQYDVLNNDKVDDNSSFQAGGGTFSTRGLNPSNSTFDVGAGLKVYNAGPWDFTTTADYTAKADYNAYSGMIRAGYKF